MLRFIDVDMEEENRKVVGISSLMTPDTWYIFRADGKQVVVRMKEDNVVSSNLKLTSAELDFLADECELKLKSYKQKIKD